MEQQQPIQAHLCELASLGSQYQAQKSAVIQEACKAANIKPTDAMQLRHCSYGFIIESAGSPMVAIRLDGQVRNVWGKRPPVELPWIECQRDLLADFEPIGTETRKTAALHAQVEKRSDQALEAFFVEWS